jgi:hypothetical protein
MWGQRYKAITSLQVRMLATSEKDPSVEATVPLGLSCPSPKIHQKRLGAFSTKRAVAMPALGCRLRLEPWLPYRSENMTRLGSSQALSDSRRYRALLALRAFSEEFQRMPDVSKTVTLADSLFHFFNRTRVHHQSNPAASRADQVIIVLPGIQ